MNVIEVVEALVARERASASAEPLTTRVQLAVNALPDVTVEHISDTRWLEHEIALLSLDHARSERELLDELRRHDIAAAPEVAAIIPLNTWCVLVRRYWSCAGDRLLRADASPPPRPDAVARYLRDMRSLADLGMCHPYARGLAHVFVGAPSGTLVMNAWHVVERATPFKCAVFLEQARAQFR